MTPAEMDQLIDLYKKGLTTDEIAKKMGRAKPTISRAIKNNKAEHPEQFGITAQTVDRGKIWALHRAHWQEKDIAGDMDITEDIVHQVIEEITEKIQARAQKRPG